MLVISQDKKFVGIIHSVFVDCHKDKCFIIDFETNSVMGEYCCEGHANSVMCNFFNKRADGIKHFIFE